MMSMKNKPVILNSKVSLEVGTLGPQRQQFTKFFGMSPWIFFFADNAES